MRVRKSWHTSSVIGWKISLLPLGLCFLYVMVVFVGKTQSPLLGHTILSTWIAQADFNASYVPLINNSRGQLGHYKLFRHYHVYVDSGHKSTKILKLLGGKVNGTFFEARARDGESDSITLGLELHNDWTGILVEPVHRTFVQLSRKNRRGFVLKGCISPLQTVTEAQLTVDVSDEVERSPVPGYPKPRGLNMTTVTATCYPFAHIMKASGFVRLDVLVLDVEGAVLDILRSIRFASFDITLILIVNAVGGSPETGFLKTANDILQPFGYQLVDRVGSDYMFMKNSRS